MSGLPTNPSTSNVRPLLRSDLRIRHSLDGRDDLYVFEDVVAGKCFELGAHEAHCLLACNGQRDIEALTSLQSTTTSPRSALNADSVRALLNWASSKQLFVDHSGQAVSRQKSSHAIQQRSRWLKWTNPLCFTWAFGSPEKLLQYISPRWQWLFDLRLLPIFCLIGLYAIGCLYQNSGRFSGQTVSIWADQQWLPLLVIWLLVKIIHELAHGIVSHRYGSRVRDCGVFFILFLPLAYVDVSGADRLSNRWQRIHIAAAGMYLELFVAAVATIVWANTSDITLGCWMHALVMSAGINTILFNANPLMRFDGYYILSDLVGIPNLAPRGRNWLVGAFKRLCLGIPSPPIDMPLPKRMVVALYGTLALVWRISIQITLTIAAAALFHGLGIFLAVLATLHYFVEPVRALIPYFRAQLPWQQIRLANLTCSLVGAVTLGWLVTTVLTETVSLSAPGVVRYPEERLVRAGGDGFVREIAVQAGQSVVAGQLLARLHNPELELQIEALQLQIEQSHQMANLARQNAEWTDYENQVLLAKSLQQQLVEREAELAGLELRSPCAGIVVHPNLEHMLGVHIKKGLPFLTIDDGRKELAISIDQDDLSSITLQQRPKVQIVFPGLERRIESLQTIHPIASEMVPAPALARKHGGPLWVQAISSTTKTPTRFNQHRQTMSDSTTDIKLISPRVTGIVELSSQSAQDLRVGQTGVVFFPSQSQSLAHDIVLRTRRWIYRHIRLAQQID